VHDEGVKEMDPEIIATEIIPRLSDKRSGAKPSVYLTISSILSKFRWHDNNLESLIEKFLAHVLEISHPSRSVRIAVHEKKRMSDLERFLSIYPPYWFYLSVEIQSTSGIEDDVKKILEGFGYHCPEWVGIEGSESQLGAFYFGTQRTTPLVLFIQNHGARRNCDFLIPVIESATYLAHAV
jgi:hypothetical protein